MNMQSKVDRILEETVRIDRDASWHSYSASIGGIVGAMAGMIVVNETQSREPQKLSTMECTVEGVPSDQTVVSVADMKCRSEYIDHDPGVVEVGAGILTGGAIGSLLVWNGIKWAATSRLGTDRYRELKRKEMG
jgi:hypothetical protein